jgi:tetratricopeptide (TPR) repeat protein
MRRTALDKRGRNLLVVAIVLGLAQAAGAAAGPREGAREATRRGTAAYNLGAYVEAAHHYEEAYRLVSDPDLLFNIGQAWRLAGSPEKALVAYKAYLRTAPTDAPNREPVRRRITELERMIVETRRLSTAPPPDTSRPPLALQVPSSVLTPDAASQSPRLEVATAAPAEPVYKRWYFWGGVGAVVAGAVVTAVVLSSSAHRSTTCGATLDYCVPVRP